jgi:hypothetical protein
MLAIPSHEMTRFPAQNILLTDLRAFDALERDVKKVEAAVKLFSKRGKAKATQELATLSEDELLFHYTHCTQLTTHVECLGRAGALFAFPASDLREI